MAPLPKKKTPRSRKGMHRSHHHTKAVALTECSHCHNARQPHMVCPNCGYYHGREAVVVSVPELPE